MPLNQDDLQKLAALKATMDTNPGIQSISSPDPTPTPTDVSQDLSDRLLYPPSFDTPVESPGLIQAMADERYRRLQDMIQKRAPASR